MEDVFLPIIICGMLFIGLPWLIFHYVIKLRQSRSLSMEDENLMDELYDLARRLTDRVETVERLLAADNPNFRPGIGRSTETYQALADDRDGDGLPDDIVSPRARFERRR